MRRDREAVSGRRCPAVIASAAKQSMAQQKESWIASLRSQ
jgi:hypothetical protein